jgi:hypothetical protein
MRMEPAAAGCIYRGEIMAAPKGNQFWKIRTKHGRDKLFASADTLWNACEEYFKWVEENPLWETKSYMYQGTPVQDQIPRMRAMTLDGLYLFLDIDHVTWRNWREDKDFFTVTHKAENVIRSQKFAGAAADMLNANIIARDLGLKDTAAHEHTSPDGSMTPKAGIDMSQLSVEALAEIMRVADAAKSP